MIKGWWWPDRVEYGGGQASQVMAELEEKGMVLARRVKARSFELRSTRVAGQREQCRW